MKYPDACLPLGLLGDILRLLTEPQGHPAVVQNKDRKGRRDRLKGKRGRGTLDKERLPIFGMIQRGGQVVINMLAGALGHMA